MIKFTVILLFVISPAFSQSFVTPNQILGQLNSIDMAVPFLLISPDARAGGMGDGGVAIAADANAMHWNLSQLAFARRKTGFSISYAPWLRSLVPDINHAYISFYTKPDSVSAIAASARYFSLGSVTFTSVTGTALGQFRPYEYAIDLGYTRRLSKKLAVGLSARIIRSNLTKGITVQGNDTKVGTGYAIDASFGYHSNMHVHRNGTYHWISGIALSNLGNKMSYSTSTNKQFQPLKLSIGEGIACSIGQRHMLNVQLELSKILIRDTNYNEEDYWILFMTSFGAEYIYNNTFKVRAGYFYEPAAIGNRQHVTLGAGVQYNVFELDFSYLIPSNGGRSPLQETLRFSILFSFDQPSAKPYPHG